MDEMGPPSTESQPPFPPIQIQSCDGITMVLCQELGVVKWDSDEARAKQRVADAIAANARVALGKKVEQLNSEEERLTRKLAQRILQNQSNLLSQFPVKDFRVVSSPD